MTTSYESRKPEWRMYPPRYEQSGSSERLDRSSGTIRPGGGI